MKIDSKNSTSADRFIPYRRSDIIKMCLDDKGLAPDQISEFQSFCEILCGIFHYEMHKSLETLKNCYAPFNPDKDTRIISPLNDNEVEQHHSDLERELTSLLNLANFEQVSESEVNQALTEESLFKVKLHVDFNDFEKVLFFRRGSTQQTETLRSWFGLRKNEIDVSLYERVVIYVRFKNKEHFQALQRDDLLFKPGTSLIKLFRNVPKNDLEMLFPNTEIRMKPIDKILIGVPTAVGGLFMLVTKLGSTLLLVFSVIAFWIGLRTQPAEINQATLIALAVGLAGLGGFLWRQFTKYKNRKIQFMKQLSENLYHKNLDNNAGVFFNIIDAAEEEECKEALLAYYHLLKSPTPMTAKQLDQNIEHWFNKKFQCVLDFEIDDALQKLERLGVVIIKDGQYQARDINLSNQILDQQWDQIFPFNQA